jgi:hypothetical protein
MWSVEEYEGQHGITDSADAVTQGASDNNYYCCVRTGDAAPAECRQYGERDQSRADYRRAARRHERVDGR